MITIVNKHDYKGVGEYIGRPSVLGNPFSWKEGTLAKYHVASRQASIDAYLPWLREQYKTNKAVHDELNRLVEIAKAGDLVLVCWCSPLPCHGDVLKSVIDKIIARH